MKKLSVLSVGLCLLLSGCATTRIQNKVCISKFINTSKEAITVTLEDGSAVKIPPGQSFECGK